MCDRALLRLRSFPMAELAATVRHVAAIEAGPIRRALEELLAGSGGPPPVSEVVGGVPDRDQQVAPGRRWW